MENRELVCYLQRKGLDGGTPLAYNCFMIIIETSIFTRQVQTLLTDDEYRRLRFRWQRIRAAGRSSPAAAGCGKFVGLQPDKENEAD
jgi:hypothetical protein